MSLHLDNQKASNHTSVFRAALTDNHLIGTFQSNQDLAQSFVSALSIYNFVTQKLSLLTVLI